LCFLIVKYTNRIFPLVSGHLKRLILKTDFVVTHCFGEFSVTDNRIHCSRFRQTLAHLKGLKWFVRVRRNTQPGCGTVPEKPLLLLPSLLLLPPLPPSPCDMKNVHRKLHEAAQNIKTPPPLACQKSQPWHVAAACRSSGGLCAL
jgi:hypothetical protein